MKYAVDVEYEPRCTRCGEFGYRCTCDALGYLPDRTVWHSIHSVVNLGLAAKVDIYNVYPHVDADSMEEAENAARQWDDGWRYKKTAAILQRS